MCVCVCVCVCACVCVWVHICHFCRRIRELKENNMKKFIDERKRYAMRHLRQAEALKKSHAEQLEKLQKENEKVSCNRFSFSVTLANPTSIFTHTHTHMHTCLHACTCSTPACTSMHACTHTCTHTHTHTHTHTQSSHIKHSQEKGEKLALWTMIKTE